MFENYKFGFLVFFLLAALGVWSYFGTIDIVTATQGVVAPSAKIKKIQHLEGGIIHSIQVREGERVAEGDALVELEGATSEAELNELQARLTTLEIDLIRLTAELENEEELQFLTNFQKIIPKKLKNQLSFLPSEEILWKTGCRCIKRCSLKKFKIWKRSFRGLRKIKNSK